MCRTNDFATALEATEPRFAAWMRHHGKQAVIKDQEVERLERAARAVCATPSRQEVMEGMYGRSDPRPAGPSYSAEEWVAMRARRQQEKEAAAMLTPQERAWLALPPIQPGFGAECGMYRWAQDLSNVHVHVKLPGHVPANEVSVSITATHLSVRLGDEASLQGELFKEVVPHSCEWFIDTGVLHVQLLKRCRAGCYNPAPRATKAGKGASTLALPAAGTRADRSPAVLPALASGTAADTFWYAVFQDAAPDETVGCQHPPTAYFFERGTDALSST